MVHASRQKSFSTIVAMSDQGINFVQVKQDTNKTADFCKFIKDLAEHLRQKFDNEVEDIILVMDGATIHTALDTRNLIKDEGLKAFMISSHSPGKQMSKTAF